jgi:hypothetical protein
VARDVAVALSKTDVASEGARRAALCRGAAPSARERGRGAGVVRGGQRLEELGAASTKAAFAAGKSPLAAAAVPRCERGVGLGELPASEEAGRGVGPRRAQTLDVGASGTRRLALQRRLRSRLAGPLEAVAGLLEVALAGGVVFRLDRALAGSEGFDGVLQLFGGEFGGARFLGALARSLGCLARRLRGGAFLFAVAVFAASRKSRAASSNAFSASLARPWASACVAVSNAATARRCSSAASVAAAAFSASARAVPASFSAFRAAAVRASRAAL